MNRYALALLTVFVMCCLITPPSMANNNFNVFTSNSQGKIITEDGAVIIRPSTGGTAHIAQDGTLTINGKVETVTPAQHRLLVQYVATINDMQRLAMQLISAVPDFTAGIVADVMADLFSGASEDQIDKKANSRAHDFAQKALPICKDAQTLKQLQDTLTASLPAFKPYAVIEDHGMHDCEHDIESDD